MRDNEKLVRVGFAKSIQCSLKSHVFTFMSWAIFILNRGKSRFGNFLDIEYGLKRQMCRMGNAIQEAYQDQLVSNDKKICSNLCLFGKVLEFIDSYNQTLEKERQL